MAVPKKRTTTSQVIQKRIDELKKIIPQTRTGELAKTSLEKRLRSDYKTATACERALTGYGRGVTPKEPITEVRSKLRNLNEFYRKHKALELARKEARRYKK